MITKFRRLIKYNIKKIVFFLLLFFFVSTASVSAVWDLLDSVFKPSIEQQGLIDLGSTKDQVGNEILRESTTINLWGDSLIQKKAPLIVRIAKLLLRITIVLAVTMVLYNWILYIIQSAKWESPKDPQKNLINIWIGILLALASLWIINLISSLTISSLKTSDDLWWNIWCKTPWWIIAWDTLKQEICLKSTFWHPLATMIYRERKADRIINRCRFGNDSDPGNSDSEKWNRKNITTSEMKSKCVSDLWWEIIK